MDVFRVAEIVFSSTRTLILLSYETFALLQPRHVNQAAARIMKVSGLSLMAQKLFFNKTLSSHYRRHP